MDNAVHILGAFAARRLADEDLFSRAISGDAAAFSEVYRRYEKRVYGFCLARSLDPEAAADATQEVFIRLLKADPATIEHPRAWLFTIARNVVIDAIRKRAGLREDGAVAEDSPAWESLAASDAADEVSARADAREVFLALRRMRPRYRTALILREIHAQSSADIAEAMGVKSVGAVDTLVSRARDAFGVAYAAISELPDGCRRSIELMYRARGSGLTTQENDLLQAHLASCERCRHEESRAGDPKRLSAMLPLLVPAGAAAHGLLGRAALAGVRLPDVSLVQHVTEFVQTHLHTLGSRIAVGVVAATLVAAPVVATVVTRPASVPPASTVGGHASGPSAPMAAHRAASGALDGRSEAMLMKRMRYRDKAGMPAGMRGSASSDAMGATRAKTRHTMPAAGGSRSPRMRDAARGSGMGASRASRHMSGFDGATGTRNAGHATGM